MQIINHGLPYLEKFWISNVDFRKTYRKIKYIVEIECEDGLILHNNISGMTILLSQKEKKDYKHMSDLTADIFEKLVQKHFLVPIDYNEKKTVDQLRTFVAAIQKEKKIVHYHILPTSTCNAKCFYCYEYGMPKKSMTKATVNYLVNFIVSNCGRDKEISLNWFGGEPTLKVDLINIICKKLEKYKIKFTSTMITNGYLLNEQLVEIARNIWKMHQVQITLDGTEMIYNSVKQFKNVDTSPYLKVMNNIKELLNIGIQVVIRLNLGEDNATDLDNLIDELRVRFQAYKNINVYIAILHDKCGEYPLENSQNTNRLLESKWDELQKKLEYTGLKKIKNNLPQLEINSCMAGDDATVVITPDGGIAKCEHLLFNSMVGSIKDGVLQQDKIKEFKKILVNEKCNQCYFYPNCYVLSKCPIVRPCTEKSIERGKDRYREVVLRSYQNWKI